MLYNQTSIEATTTSPYFTPEFIDAKCLECSTTNNPQVMTVACDICKTLTVKTVTTYSYFDFLILLVIVISPFIIIKLFSRKK